MPRLLLRPTAKGYSYSFAMSALHTWDVRTSTLIQEFRIVCGANTCCLSAPIPRLRLFVLSFHSISGIVPSGMCSLVDWGDPACAQEEQDEQAYMLLAFWLGGIIYGIYVILFGLSAKISIGTRRVHSTFSARVFSISTCVMFILTTIYMAFTGSRFLYAFGPEWNEVSGGKIPIHFLHDYTSYQNLVPTILTTLHVWFGDALAVMTFPFIPSSLRIRAMTSLINIPCIASVVNNSIITVWFSDPTFLAPQQVGPLINTVFPTNIMQSCITTGLISFKIWNRHRLSRRAGLSEHGSGVGLLTVVRFVVESTMIFTIQQIITCILYYLDNPAQYIFHGTLVPSIGITFVLLSIRIHEAQHCPRKVGIIIQHTSSRHSPPLGTLSSGTNAVGAASDRAHRNRSRNHRRTMSESLDMSVRSISVHESGPGHPTGQAGEGEGRWVDMQKGIMKEKDLADDEIAAVNHPAGLLG
ncbi:hypothetical protein NMY22_g15927 [Coprinellus aureogranulatus]|nr:hypothetical protein NMY22_g15927 [Coprinellus aureogranulatus]